MYICCNILTRFLLKNKKKKEEFTSCVFKEKNGRNGMSRNLNKVSKLEKTAFNQGKTEVYFISVAYLSKY